MLTYPEIRFFHVIDWRSLLHHHKSGSIPVGEVDETSSGGVETAVHFSLISDLTSFSRLSGVVRATWSDAPSPKSYAIEVSIFPSVGPWTCIELVSFMDTYLVLVAFLIWDTGLWIDEPLNGPASHGYTD
ncbi:unnamed protein product [Protopolystoma xenopodis]|uniref:Uncharacterized protein n=1 Tax=Protopolystoma xenopodis TaxID=117903 RepID=A0A3S4ZZV8_9PLAT|nr:unnamed protein product [Protopolystoma xenopodis]